MDKNLKKFIVSIVLFVTGTIGSALLLIAHSIVLGLNDTSKTVFPMLMFAVMLGTAITGLVMLVKNLKK